MTNYSPTELVETLGSGLLSFPVTHFDADLQFDEPAYREHLEWLSGYPVAGLFAAGGTGEGFSLTADETDRVVRAAIAGAGGKVPVLAPATGSTVNAVAQVQAAEKAGADGILLMPPYLTEAGQRGPGRAHQRRLRRRPTWASSTTRAPTPSSAPTRSSRPASATPTSSASRTASARSSR